MIDASHIKAQTEVKGSDGKHVGTVDAVEENRVRLASGGMYHDLDVGMIEKVKDGVVWLSTTAEQTTRSWH